MSIGDEAIRGADGAVAPTLQPARGRELIAAFLIAGAFLAAASAIGAAAGFRSADGLRMLLAGPLKLDDIYSYRIIADPSRAHAWQTLREADVHLPTTFVFMRGFAALVGGSTHAHLRLFSILSVLLAATGIYATLRLALRPLPSAVGVAATLSHILVLRAAVELRLYGPMLAWSAWFAYFVVRRRLNPSRVAGAVLLALSAGLLCTNHYFGIFAWALVLLGDAMFKPPIAEDDFARRLAGSGGSAHADGVLAARARATPRAGRGGDMDRARQRPRLSPVSRDGLSDRRRARGHCRVDAVALSPRPTETLTRFRVHVRRT